MLHTLDRVYEALGTAAQGPVLDLLVRWAVEAPDDMPARLKETKDWNSNRIDGVFRRVASNSPGLGRLMDIACVIEQKILMYTLGLPIESLRLPAPENVFHLFLIGVAQQAFLYPTLVSDRSVEFGRVVCGQMKRAIFQAVSAGPLEGPVPLLGGRPPAPKPRPLPAVPAPMPAMSLDALRNMPPPPPRAPSPATSPEPSAPGPLPPFGEGAPLAFGQPTPSAPPLALAGLAGAGAESDSGSTDGEDEDDEDEDGDEGPGGSDSESDDDEGDGERLEGEESNGF